MDRVNAMSRRHTHQMAVLPGLWIALATVQWTVYDAVVAARLFVSLDVLDAHDDLAAVVPVLTGLGTIRALALQVVLQNTHSKQRRISVRQRQEQTTEAQHRSTPHRITPGHTTGHDTRGA
jgi:hypothetical protein